MSAADRERRRRQIRAPPLPYLIAGTYAACPPPAVQVFDEYLMTRATFDDQHRGNQFGLVVKISATGSGTSPAKTDICSACRLAQNRTRRCYHHCVDRFNVAARKVALLLILE
jgi:hypothetical protein